MRTNAPRKMKRFGEILKPIRISVYGIFCIFVKIRNSFYGEYADQFAIFLSEVRGIRARTGGSHDADFVSLPARLGRLIPS